MKSLEKHYDVLTPQERFPLILSAVSRGDAEERAKLIHASSKQQWIVCDFVPLARSFEHLCQLYVMRQLELIVRFKESVETQEFELSFAINSSEDHLKSNCLPSEARLAAYYFGVNSRAMDTVCAEAGLNVQQLLEDLPGAALVLSHRPPMELPAFSRDEASQYLRSLENSLDEESVDDELMVTAFRDALRSWYT